MDNTLDQNFLTRRVHESEATESVIGHCGSTLGRVGNDYVVRGTRLALQHIRSQQRRIHGSHISSHGERVGIGGGQGVGD